MTKKIRLVTVLAIVAIIASASLALTIYYSRQVDTVEELNMAENTSSSVDVSWQSVKGADGYRIYIKNDESGEYELYKEIASKDKKTSEYSFSDLESTAVLDIKVSAFKSLFNKTYEGKMSQGVTVYTLPDTVSQKSYSGTEGSLTIKWEAQENITGYEVEYSKEDEFKEPETQSADAESEKIRVENLTPDDVYYTRVRSFFTVNDEAVYGGWSDTCEVTIRQKVEMYEGIDADKPIIAFSFDDGPAYTTDDGTNTTEQILDVLEEYGARATFFMCASRINSQNEDCLSREIALGCELGNHTYDHTAYGKEVTAKDISKCSDKIKSVCGQSPTIFRSPGGIMTSIIRKECSKEGMPIAYWSVDTEDWKSKDAEQVYEEIMENVYDGSIILMHDIYPSTVEAVKKAVPALIEEGYQIVTVTEMLTVKNSGNAPKPGQQYVDYDTINNNTK